MRRREGWRCGTSVCDIGGVGVDLVDIAALFDAGVGGGAGDRRCGDDGCGAEDGEGDDGGLHFEGLYVGVVEILLVFCNFDGSW